VDHEEWLDLADVYALGALDGDDLTQFEAHLSAGCSTCRDRLRGTTESLVLGVSSLESVAPPPGLKGLIVDRIEQEKHGFLFTFADQGEWRAIGPGLTAKILSLDSARQRVTALVRMEPGSRYENHRHAETEEMYVLAGSCYCGGRLLRKGDYHRAEVGSIHLDTHTEEGSLMLIITSTQNDTLA
jgi:quercetin dioxygenase-like cupin family protein